MLFTATRDVTSISHAGVQYDADENGFLELPDDASESLIIHVTESGFVPARGKKGGKKQPAQQAASDADTGAADPVSDSAESAAETDSAQSDAEKAAESVDADAK